ncbi:hypothetical protein ADIAG_02202 [Paeniglutamicibacter gangotriensis Lz1y]|uniref:Prokaryotic metallothionein n=2 Tax=Paeniglutamicibacter gangotriensis TaxID=254787 RepID=M7MT43_9MICC|nr:hypothetical protein [Paeniglutamicibacter gangotriensis]EMQ98186.1 hypothetical protein ADIAG_02202 [Paeniglutamicibacter gangotriensis Lz1y]KAA0975741.1 hypothetical protein FQ154_13120 [Paeniglutamicibacter gangotriensis]
MTTCDTCGNSYENTFTITREGQTKTFDSFECAVHLMAPTCSHCGCRILGHGVQSGTTMFCCAHCAREAGHEQASDRA